jgi:4-hydroxybenzoate polyprenyltransferase
MGIWIEGKSVDLARLAALVSALICTDAGLTTWNDIADLETDAASQETHRSGRPLLTGTLSVRWGTIQVLALETVALVLAFWLEPVFGILLLALIIYGWLYSRPRRSFANSTALQRGLRQIMWPFIYQFFWLIIWPCIFVAVALVLGADSHRAWLYILGNVFFMGLAETLAKDLRDIKNDAYAEKRTGAVALGIKRSARWSIVGFSVGAAFWLAASVSVQDWNPGLTAGLAIVLVLWIGRASILANELQQSYSVRAARDLQMGATRVFLTVNLLFISGLLG